MIPELNAENIGQVLGLQGADNLLCKVEQYCKYEERRIALKNQPRTVALRAEIGMLQDEEHDLRRRVALAPATSSLKGGRRKVRYYWTVAVLLALAAFVFALLAFEPYQLGWKAYFYCCGIAVVTPFLLHESLERWNVAGIIRALATFATLAALFSLIVLAVIRGDILGREMETATPVVVDSTESAEPQQPQTDFYRDTLDYLRLAMALLALAIELGAGLALHQAWHSAGDDGDNREQLLTKLRQTRERMIANLAELTQLENEPASFASRFWRNFYHASLTHIGRSALTKLLLAIAVLVAPVIAGHAAERERTTIVMAIDLTQSVAGRGPDAQTDFEKNVAGVASLLAQAPSSSRIVVLGITDQSFAHPYILLSATVTSDAGYFHEKLQAARRQLVKAWKDRARRIEPTFRETDILGALVIANQIFDNAPVNSQKILVIFSDMRHHTRDLDLESIPGPRLVKLKNRVTPVLKDVQVYALGVDGGGKSFSYWQSLMRFWTEYFKSAGATVRAYSVLRDFITEK